MDSEVKAKWIAALRSGKYQQARGQLRSDSGFCCLGVLCDVVAPREWRLSAGRLHWRHLDERNTPDCQLSREIGLTQPYEEWLANMNDLGKSFAEIADYIQEHL